LVSVEAAASAADDGDATVGYLPTAEGLVGKLVHVALARLVLALVLVVERHPLSF